ncbi:hypothetical protein L7F22_052798 [Adiantum nelumboides]|nr:hypothetical protein [Adiantum nelumboides]
MLLDGKITNEPLKVFIKFFDEFVGIDIFRHMIPSKEQETEICHQFSLSGKGAKVYGFFETKDGVKGRIDEFLDGRTLEPIDVENDEIRADIAISFAHFHNIKLLSMTKTSIETYFDAVITGLQSLHKLSKLKILGEEAGVCIDSLIDYDFAEKVKDVGNAMKSIKAKTGWCIHDVQYMNTMVKNHPKPKESKISLIDFENVMYNYRGFDIGGHYLHKMFKWFDEENKIVNCKKFSKEEKVHFCQTYAKEWNKLTGDTDTGEQIYLEAEYGYLLSITFELHNMLWFITKCNKADRLDLKALLKLFEEFKEQYTKLTQSDLAANS